jgi:5-methylcytosine-specific restriction protein A
MTVQKSALRPAGSTRKWRKIRMQILQRDKYMCQYCRKRRATHVDHVKPRSRGGLDGDKNLVASCQKCNLAKSGNLRKRTGMPY